MKEATFVFHARTETGIGTALQDYRLHVKALSSVPRLVTWPRGLDNVDTCRVLDAPLIPSRTDAPHISIGHLTRCGSNSCFTLV